MSGYDDGYVAALQRAMEESLRPTYTLPKPPAPHPLEQLRLVTNQVELQEWEKVWQTAAVSGQAQIVLAPSRVLICWPNRTVDEVWFCG